MRNLYFVDSITEGKFVVADSIDQVMDSPEVDSLNPMAISKQHEVEVIDGTATNVIELSVNDPNSGVVSNSYLSNSWREAYDFVTHKYPELEVVGCTTVSSNVLVL